MYGISLEHIRLHFATKSILVQYSFSHKSQYPNYTSIKPLSFSEDKFQQVIVQ